VKFDFKINKFGIVLYFWLNITLILMQLIYLKPLDVYMLHKFYISIDNVCRSKCAAEFIKGLVFTNILTSNEINLSTKENSSFLIKKSIDVWNIAWLLEKVF